MGIFRKIGAAGTLAALLAGTGTAASAAGWYGRADVGYSVEGSADIKTDSGFAWGRGKFKDDITEFAGFGYAFHNSGFRLELEGGHRFNEIKHTTAINGGGKAYAWSVMGNLFYDFHHNGPVEPYLGVGIGAAEVGLRTTNLPAPIWFIHDKDTNWAWQGLAGVAFKLSHSWKLDLGYKYFAVPSLNVTGIELAGPSAHSHDVSYRQQSVNLGLRWSFGAAAAPPPPAPPPPPPAPAPKMSTLGPYKVYFQWNKYTLTKEARATIDEVASQVKNKKINKVHIEGDTDTSGTGTYNQELSDERAGAVRDALIADGVPASVIDTVGLGETNPAVKTGDSVKEPLNRRAEITITVGQQ